VVGLIDPEKVSHFNKIKHTWIKKENIFSFLIGVVSSFLVSMITEPLAKPIKPKNILSKMS